MPLASIAKSRSTASAPMSNNMDPVVLRWAQDSLIMQIESFADDPHGYCGHDSLPVDAWAEITYIARALGMDAESVLHSAATDFERERINKLIGKNIS